MRGVVEDRMWNTGGWGPNTQLTPFIIALHVKGAFGTVNEQNEIRLRAEKILDESERAVVAHDRIRVLTGGDDVTVHVTYGRGDADCGEALQGYTEKGAEKLHSTLCKLEGGVVFVHLHLGDSSIAFATTIVVIVSVNKYSCIVATVVIPMTVCAPVGIHDRRNYFHAGPRIRHHPPPHEDLLRLPLLLL
jgi:hypothetical protein